MSQTWVMFFIATKNPATTKHKPNIGHILCRDEKPSHTTKHKHTAYLCYHRSTMQSSPSYRRLIVYKGFIASKAYGQHTEERQSHLCWVPGTANVLITRTGHPSIDLRVDREISAIYVERSLLLLCLN